VTIAVKRSSGQISDLIATYPRQRPPLSKAWQAAYVNVYRASRTGATPLYAVTQWLERWMHRAVCDDRPGTKILDIGAGTLNHVGYEPLSAVYDIVEPFSALFQGRPELSRVRSVYSDIADVPEYQRYDRIVTVATLEHVEDLPRVLARAGLLLGPQGRLAAAIPSEGGALWGFSWRCSVGVASWLCRGLDYGELMRHEHLNDAKEITALVGHFFSKVTIRRFPMPFYHASLYTAIVATDPDIETCRRALAA
jgi:SAM-dependent methyltransferase